MQLDRILTIAIGDLDTEGNRISPADYDYWAHTIAQDVRDNGGTVYAVTFGDGIGSDGVNDGAEERSAVILAGNVDSVDRLRATVGFRLTRMGASSACFALDGAHEPAFATIDGRRP